MDLSQRKFLRSLIGAPYQVGGSGPAWDCYGLTKHVLWTLYKIDLPDREHAISLAYARQWRRLTMPADGALVLMGVQDKHVGVFLAGGFLHAMSGTGVVFDDLLSLRFRGLGRIRMYLPA